MLNTKTRKLTAVAMLCAITYVVMVLGRVPVVLFLKYDPKDVIITIGGFIYGPLTAFYISVIVSFLEMLTVSQTGIIGCIMNIISSCSFACTASYIYKKRHNAYGAVLGLLAGCALMAVLMLSWNYLIVPLYMVKTSRSDVAAMLIPIFLPFNLLKGGLNTAITLLLYKPIVTALRKTNIIEQSEHKDVKQKKLGVMLIAVLLLVTCIFFMLVIKGIL